MGKRIAITIEPLPKGYVVSQQAAINEIPVAVAALSRFDELVEWLAEQFDEPVPGPVGITNQVVDGGKPKLFADLALPTDQALKDEFDAAHKHRGPAGPADADAPQAATLEDVRAQLEARTPEPAPAPAPADPSATERDRIIAALTDNQAKVFDCLSLKMMTAGEWFIMSKNEIAEGAGVEPGAVQYTVQALKARKLVNVKSNGPGHPVRYWVDIPETDADG